MFYSLGYEPKGTVLPGELIYVNNKGQVFNKRLVQKEFNPCIFEYVYFARPDATLNDVSVYRARLRMDKIWRKHGKKNTRRKTRISLFRHPVQQTPLLSLLLMNWVFDIPRGYIKIHLSGELLLCRARWSVKNL